MGLRRLRGDLRAADLEHNHRLAIVQRAACGVLKARRGAHGFREQCYDTGVRFVHQIIHHTHHVHRWLVSRRGETTQPHSVLVRKMRDEICDCATLRDDTDISGQRRRAHRSGPACDPGTEVNETEAVRAQQRDSQVACRREQLVLQLRTFAAEFREAAGEDHRIANSGGANIADDVQHGIGGHQHQRNVDRFADRRAARQSLLTVRHPAAAADEVDLAGEAKRFQIRVSGP